MIVWPEESRTKSVSREAIRLFRESGAASDLEASKDQWSVIAWPWALELPMRFLFENGSRHCVAATLRDGGTWVWTEEPREYHIRSVESLERDARGLRD